MGKCHNPVPVTSLTHCSLLQWAVVAPSMSCLQAIRNTECLAMVLRGKAPTKWLHFYPPFCLTYSAASNVILCYSLFSLPLSHVSTPIHSFTFPHPLSLLSHYHSLVPWPGLVLTVLVSIRTLPLGCGPACVWSNGTTILIPFLFVLLMGFSSKSLSAWCKVPS